MITKDMVEHLLNWFDLGASTAENDPLLEVAKIETQEYYDLYYKDRIDIIKGIKGSGKTALYRLLYFLKDYSVSQNNLYSIFGVEATGDPVFRQFYSEFDGYSEIEFENFWNIYFLLLINSLVEENAELRDKLKADKDEIKKIIDDIGIKISKSSYNLKESISSIQSIFRESNKEPTLMNYAPIFQINSDLLDDIKIKPLYVAEFRERITNILKKHQIKIWIMLDRLDEVFPHRSSIEKNGLKGLLKSSYNYSCTNLRIKIFLRDDILDFVSNDGFTAFTHVSDRCSSTMTWSKEELLLLIVKRLTASSLKEYYSIDETKIGDKEYRYKVFNSIFPSKIGTMNTMDWIFNNCGDSNGIVTPRDIIDFFKYAKAEQMKAFKINPQDQDRLIKPEFFKIALDELSKHKRTHFLLAEFPHLKSTFLKFEGGYSEYDVGTLKEMIKDNYSKTLDDLKSVGFLKYNPKSGTYKIPVIWRKGFNIRRKKFISSSHNIK